MNFDRHLLSFEGIARAFELLNISNIEIKIDFSLRVEFSVDGSVENDEGV